MLALSVLAGPVTAADSRDYSVTVSTPTPVSAGGVTKFDITVDSDDNQTIANMHLSVPAMGGSLPAGVTITTVFGPDAALCSPPTAAGLSCNLGNFAGNAERHISVLASVAASVAGGTVLTFTASAETNNENGSNLQVEPGSASVTALAFDANAITTFNLTGQAGTSTLGSPGAGNLHSRVNLLQNNGGVGNAIAIVEGSSATQPAYCVSLKLTCQPDFVDLTVNGGAAVTPYLETTLVAVVPNKYNLKKAFVIHVLENGTVETGFPLFNTQATSCVAHPDLVPCADFSQVGNVVTITVHTFGNGRMGY
jgi:hypothetical protein